MAKSPEYLPQQRIFNSIETDQQNPPGRFSYWITTASFFIALAVFILAPILAIKWSRNPFPGFVFEQSGVVANVGKKGWSGRDAGVDYPQRIIYFDNKPITQTRDLKNLLNSAQVGQGVTMQTEGPNGLKRFYSYINITNYPKQDLIKYFWLPYSIGLIYLVIGGVIYVLRGFTKAALSFAFFCVCTSIVCALSFDLSTTHVGTALWTTAIAMLGGAIMGLALLFPKEIEPIQRRSSMRIFTYLISIGLVIWGWFALYASSDPWAYVIPWRMSFFYTGFSLVVLLVMLLFRLQNHPSAIERQQIRIILFGSLIAFVVICSWLFSPLLKVFLPWDPSFFMPLILFFPLSVGIAILRYRLWTIDVIIHRTLVYGILTGALGLIYFISVVLLTQIFKFVMGETSSLVVVISTLIIASLFTPLRKRIQNVIDRRLYRNKINAEEALAAFAGIVRDEVDLDILQRKLLQLVQETFQPEHVGLWLKEEEEK
jgi:MFS family permease